MTGHNIRRGIETMVWCQRVHANCLYLTMYAVAYPGVGKRGAKPEGAAPGQGRTLPRGAACQNVFCFVCAAGNCSLPGIIHNEVAQVGIEGEINAEAVWPLRCVSDVALDRRVSNAHGDPVKAGRANISLCPLPSRKSTERQLCYQAVLKEVSMQQKSSETRCMPRPALHKIK